MDKELKEKLADLLNRKRPSVSANQILALIKEALPELRRTNEKSI